MDDNELLLRHAARWAAERGRALDRSLLDDALRLRALHDGLAANRWPSRSVEHLMLVRWPAHGPDGCPDVDSLVATLDTFWRFLRSTGRMAGASAEPKDLLREAKAAGRRMPAACADAARFSASKSLMAFGREIGITMDDIPDLEEANARLQQIVEAWNALPDAERMGRTGDAGSAGSRMGGALTSAAASVQRTGDVPPGWELPAMPRLDDEAEESLFPSDPEVSAPFIRESGFIRQLLALTEWVGEGREVTATGVLRPAVAREAYQALGLWDWEREWLRTSHTGLPEDPDAEAALAATTLRSWRTARDCLALDRLWAPAVFTGALTLDSRTAVRARPGGAIDQGDAMGWVQFGLQAMVALVERAEEAWCFEPLLGVLLGLSERYGGPSSLDELHETWWASETNAVSRGLPNSLLARRESDRELDQCLAMFGDCGLWVRRRGLYVGTPYGWDVALFLMSFMDDDELGMPPGDF